MDSYQGGIEVPFNSLFQFCFFLAFVLCRLHEMVWGLMSSDVGLTYLGQKASLPSAEERHSPHKTTVAYSDCLMQYATLLSAPSSSLSVTGHDTCICPIKFIRYWSCHFYLPHHHVYPLLVTSLVSAPSSLSVTGHATFTCPIIKFICYSSCHFYPPHHHVYPFLVMPLLSVRPLSSLSVTAWS